MKEYIVHPPKDNRLAVEEYSTFYGEPVKELIKCKDCQYYLGLAECEMIGFCGGTNFYCGWGKRKKNE